MAICVGVICYHHGPCKPGLLSNSFTHEFPSAYLGSLFEAKGAGFQPPLSKHSEGETLLAPVGSVVRATSSCKPQLTPSFFQVTSGPPFQRASLVNGASSQAVQPNPRPQDGHEGSASHFKDFPEPGTQG